MRQHLSEEQMTSWLAGERFSLQVEHVAECEACRAEIARSEKILGAFRGAVRAWTADVRPQAVGAGEARQLSLRGFWAWSGAAALVAVMVVLFAMRVPPVWQEPGLQVTATGLARKSVGQSSLSDVALSQQISSQLSQSVATPMQALYKVSYAKVSE